MHNHTHARISFSAGCSELLFSLLLLCFNTIFESDRIDSQRFYTFSQKLYSNNFVQSLTGLSPTAIVNLCSLPGKKNEAIPQQLRPIFWEVCLIVVPFLTFLTSIMFSTEVVRNLGAVFWGTQRQFSENIDQCSEDDLRSRILGTFVVKFLACLPLLGFSNI